MISEINRNGYEVNDYYFKDFSKLNKDEIMMVWEWRNSPQVRKWMYNQNQIDYNEHVGFVKSLANRDDKYYWLVYKDKNPIGVYDITNINREQDTAENGLYMNPSSQYIGSGFDFVKACFYMFFGVMEIERAVGGAAADNKNILYIDQFLGFEFSKSYIKIIDGKPFEFLYSENLTRNKFLDIYNGNSSEKDFIKWYRNQKKKK